MPTQDSGTPSSDVDLGRDTSHGAGESHGHHHRHSSRGARKVHAKRRMHKIKKFARSAGIVLAVLVGITLVVVAFDAMINDMPGLDHVTRRLK
jgi:hypothetical protein